MTDISEYRLKKILWETLAELMETQPPQMVDTAEAARLLRVKKNTLERWRTAGTGPAYHKVGSNVLYAIKDLNRYLAENRIGESA